LPSSQLYSLPLGDVAGVALSARLRGCADKVAELLAIRSTAQRRGRRGFFGTPEGLRRQGCRTPGYTVRRPDTWQAWHCRHFWGAAQTGLPSSWPHGLALRGGAGVALSALLSGCADRVAELLAIRSGARRRGRRGTFGTPEGLRRQGCRAPGFTACRSETGRRGTLGTSDGAVRSQDCRAHGYGAAAQRRGRRGAFGTSQGLRKQGCRALL
jgi:hypothetical protein